MTNKYRVILQPTAEQNVDEIHEWIAARSPEGAIRWHRKLDESIRGLSMDADRYAEAPESHRFEKQIRNLTFRMRGGRIYRVLFTIWGDEVHVLYVRGPGQDWIAP